MPRSNARMQSAWEKALSFALLGALAGGMGGAGIFLSIWLFGGLFIPALPIAFAIGGFVGGFLIALVAREGVGGLVERATGGTRGRSRMEYSHAQALVVRGAYEDAVKLYAEAADEHPDDPEPLVLGARVLRDNLRRPDDAADWLRRAARVSPLRKETEITIARELVELYDGPLGRPQEALPELARLIEKYDGTRAADWARTRMGRIRALVWQDLKGEEHDA